MTSDLLAALSRSTPWTAGAQLSGFNRLSTKHRCLSQSHCSSVLHIWKQTVFQLCSYHCLVWVEWFRSEINQCFFVLFLALSFWTFSWPGPSVSPPSGLLQLYVFSSVHAYMHAVWSFFHGFFPLFFHLRMHCGMSPLTIIPLKSY